MAFNIKNTLGAIESHISSTGYVSNVQVGEPVSPPDANDKIFGAIFMNSANVVELSLGTTIELHSVTVRLHRRAAFGQGDNAGEVEEEMALALSQISSNLIGEFDLGGTLRAIDIAGQYGSALTATWGYVTIAQTMFRIVDLVLPLIVDDSATTAA